MSDKQPLWKRLVDRTGVAEFVEEYKADSNLHTWSDVKKSLNTTIPPRGTHVVDLLDYIEACGSVRSDIGALTSRDLKNPLVALCRTNLDTNPELVTALVHRMFESEWDLADQRDR